MKIASFGQLSIEVTPTSANPEILSVDIGAQTRKEAMSMQTNKDETVDQFCQRVRSMLRALINSEPRVVEVDKKADAKEKAKTWEEQKAGMKPQPKQQEAVQAKA